MLFSPVVKLHLMENILPQHAHPLRILLSTIVKSDMELAIGVLQRAVIIVLQLHVPKLDILELLDRVLVQLVIVEQYHTLVEY